MQQTTVVNGREIEVNEQENFIRFKAGTPLEDIYEALGRKIQELNEDVRINAVINAFNYKDAAFQWHKALDKTFSFVSAKQNMFGGTDNSSLQVEVAPGVFEQVAWGKFEVPGVRGWLQTSTTEDAFGRRQLQITGIVRRKHEKDVLEAISLATQLVQTESIYRNRAIEVRYKDDNGYTLAEPDIKFVKTDPTLRDRIVFGAKTDRAINVHLYTPIEHRDLTPGRKVARKRGILFYGPYGTGKTLTMAAAAALAVEHGMTYLKVARADDLAIVIRDATQFLGASVVTCEDIDQVLAGERSTSINDILNTIDTTDQNVELIVVLTTNHVDRISKPMLRAGRLDAKIYVAPPDAAAAERLMRMYGGEQIDATEDISAAANLMAGNNAGDIREVVERAKLAELHRNPTPNAGKITGEDLLGEAELMLDEIALSKEDEPDVTNPIIKAAEIRAAAVNTLSATLGSTQSPVANTLTAIVEE